jgi:hypothetical protein
MEMRPSGQISIRATLPPLSITPLTARLTSASVNLVLDIKTVERGIEGGEFFDIHSIMRSVLIPSKVEVAWRIVG